MSYVPSHIVILSDILLLNCSWLSCRLITSHLKHNRSLTLPLHHRQLAYFTKTYCHPVGWLLTLQQATSFIFILYIMLYQVNVFIASIMNITIMPSSLLYRESRDFKMADSCQNPSIQVRLSLVFPLILIRLAWGLKQKTPEKWK